MSYKIATLALVALHALTATALPPCVCTRNLRPVCGSDGHTYSNQCLLDCQKYKTGADITMEKEGPCETPCICTFEYKPVCGTDGNTYSNKCSLLCQKSAQPTLDVASENACADVVKVAEPPCICTEEIDIVCGSDGNSYDNPCQLNCATAKNPSLGIEHRGRCVDKVKVVELPLPQVPACVCTEELNEVCGSDGTTYANPCLLNCATANNPSLGIKSHGKCDSVNVVNPFPGDQPNCACPRNLKPVCGSDGNTYNNDCLLRCTGQQVSLARLGSCE